MQFYFTNLESLKGERWDPNYWRSDLLIAIQQLQTFKLPLHKIEDIAEVTIGQSGKRTFIEEKEVQYIVVGDLLPSGIVYGKNPRWVSLNGFNDPQRSRLENNDILVVISGGGSIGRSTLVYDVDHTANISQDIARVRLKNFFVYSTFLFLQSKWGVSQIHRFENGTGVTHLNQEEVRSILIPEMDEKMEEWCKEQVLLLKEMHLNAVISNNKEQWKQVEKNREKTLETFSRKLIHMARK